MNTLQKFIICLAVLWCAIAFAEDVSVELVNGQIWVGEIGQTVSVTMPPKEERGGNTIVLTGELTRVTDSYIMVVDEQAISGYDVIFIRDIVSINTELESIVSEELEDNSTIEDTTVGSGDISDTTTSAVTDPVDTTLAFIQCQKCNQQFSDLFELIKHLAEKQSALIRDQEEIESLLFQARNSLSANKEETLKPKETLTAKPILKRFHGGELRIDPRQYFIYKLKGARRSFEIFNFIGVHFKSLDSKGEPKVRGDTAGYFKIDGQTEELTIETTTPDVVTTTRRSDGSYDYAFTGSGVAIFHVKLAGSTTVVRIPVIELAVSKGTKSVEVISGLGLPDRKEIKITTWPNTESPDGIIYSPSAGKNVVARHWYYEKIPHAVIAMQGGYVTDSGYYVSCDHCDVAHEDSMDFYNWMNNDLDSK
jgi:hypothetical protein